MFANLRHLIPQINYSYFCGNPGIEVPLYKMEGEVPQIKENIQKQLM